MLIHIHCIVVNYIDYKFRYRFRYRSGTDLQNSGHRTQVQNHIMESINYDWSHLSGKLVDENGNMVILLKYTNRKGKKEPKGSKDPLDATRKILQSQTHCVRNHFKSGTLH